MVQYLINRSKDPNAKTDVETAQFLKDFLLYREFGWTPKQIEELTDFTYDAIYAVLETEWAIEKQKEEARKRNKKTDPRDLVQA